MTYKGYHLHILLLTCAVMAYYFMNEPLFPIRAEVKKALGYMKETFLNFTELTAQHGYLSKEYVVTTKDGYILTLFRMVKGKNCKGNLRKPPVILMHGLLQSSDVWLDAGPKAGLAYLLSDACYDLWTGNQRGNYYSRKHIFLDPDEDEKFWNFTVDEIGYYDIPATIDYILQHTGSETVNYIGYSQGSGTFYIMCSENPGFCDKVNLHIGVAPASRHTHTRSIPMKTMIRVVEKLGSLLDKVGAQEIFPKGALVQEFLEFFCQWPMIAGNLCHLVNSLIDSSHPGSITDQTNRILFSHFPAGTSIQNLIRYSQSTRSPYFEKFNHGKKKNLQLYGYDEPPQYNLSAVTAPVVIFYGENDYLVDPKDVEWLVGKLPNILESVLVNDTLWNHLDPVYSQYTIDLIFPKINEYLLKYTFT